jgi:PEP-CTERM motif-containing protein
VEVLGNVFSASTISSRSVHGSFAITAGDVTIQNYRTVQVTGSISPGGSDTRTYGIVANAIGRNPNGGDVTITNIGSGGVSIANGINTGNSDAASNWASDAGHVTISTTGSVTLGHLVTGLLLGSQFDAGDATITGSSVLITGDIMMDEPNGGDGILALTATGGVITIGEQGSAPDLDLSRIDYVSLGAAADSTIYGLILAGDGSAADGVTTGSHQIGSDLQAVTGQVVYYDSAVNPDLFAGAPGGIYTLTGGGELKALNVQPVPEPAGLGLMGLALLGLKKRRS